MDGLKNQNSLPDDEVNLLDYLIVLAKHSRMIIFVSVAVTILTYGYLFCKPNTYTAKALLLPPKQNLTLSGQLLDSLGGRVSPGAGGAGGLASSLLGLKSSGVMYVAIMHSDPVLNHIITRFHLMELYKTKYLEDARKALSKGAKITHDKKDDIITIEVTGTNSKLAAEMANAFIEELERLLQSLAVQEAKERLAFLEKERLRASQNMTKAEEAVRHFSEQNSVLQIDTQTRGAIEYIARLRADIDAKEVSMQVLRERATPLNYEVVRVEAEIKGLKEKLRGAESQMANCVSDVCLPTSKTPGLAMEYLNLFREAKFQEGLYQLYSKLVEVAHLDMVRDVAVVQVLAPAMPPDKKSNKRALPAMMGGILAFFMMSVVAFGREHMQKMQNSEDDMQRLSVLKNYLKPWRNILTRMKNLFCFKKRS